MKVLITGAKGQLGWELLRTVPVGVEVFATDAHDLDITQADAVYDAVESYKPDAIINAAAYTAVDKAEQEKELAFTINADGAGNLAKAAWETGSRLIHISTDFIFDGKQSHPYKPSDKPNPINVYGGSKYEGEKKIRDAGCASLIIRTAWVYSMHGNNFVKTMLRLMSERDELQVVADQIGTPTWARNLAEVVWCATKDSATGIYHFTDAGVASWYDFAIAIQEEASMNGLITRRVPIKPISTEDYPTPARRPAFSVLDKAIHKVVGLELQYWRSALRSMLSELRR